MTNTGKLKGRITEMGFSLSSFAEAVHLSRPCLRMKLSGQSDFRASEIEKICVLLDIPHSEVCSYFFTAVVPKMETIG